MKKLIATLTIFLLPLTTLAAEPAQVLFLGTFHFQDAGKDLVKVKDVNVMTDESQAYLEHLTDRLAAFRPTHVLLEYGPEYEDKINERYREYVAGDYELGVNEIYQLGFRIAKKAGLEQVQSFDHRELHWAYQPMADYAEQHKPDEWTEYHKLIENFTAEQTRLRAELNLQQMLENANDPEKDKLNMGSYLVTNSIGVEDGWTGADATATWWQRNFRMYAKVQKAAQPGMRVLAIAGSGHTSILKFLVSIDGQREGVDALPYLRADSESP